MDLAAQRVWIPSLDLHGCCMSYDDLGRFLTSAAEVEIDKLQEAVYVPNGTVSITDGGNLVHEGDDNIDINADTVDGKNTFHSMARVVFWWYSSLQIVQQQGRYQ